MFTALHWIQSLIATIARFEDTKTQLERGFLHFDGDYASTSNNSNNNAEKSFVWQEIDATFENRILTSIIINADYIESRQFLEDISSVRANVRHNTETQLYKSDIIFNGKFATGHKRAKKVLILKTMNTFKHRTCVSDTSSNPCWHGSSLEEFQERDNGWALLGIMNFTININKCKPMRVEYRFEMPRKIMTKKAVINVRSMDNACWSFISNWKKRGSRIFQLTLYDGAEFSKYRISYNVKRHNKIRTSQWCVH